METKAFHGRQRLWICTSRDRRSTLCEGFIIFCPDCILDCVFLVSLSSRPFKNRCATEQAKKKGRTSEFHNPLFFRPKERGFEEKYWGRLLSCFAFPESGFLTWFFFWLTNLTRPCWGREWGPWISGRPRPSGSRSRRRCSRGGRSRINGGPENGQGFHFLFLFVWTVAKYLV